MSGSVGTMRAGSNRHTGHKDKMSKNEKNISQQTPVHTKNESNKIQPTQDQIRLAQMMSSNNQSDANPDTVRELMDMTGKSEDVVVIALHDAENDADRAVMMLLEGGDEQQNEWQEQSGKKKKKASSHKEAQNHADDHFESRVKDRGDRDDHRNDRGDKSDRSDRDHHGGGDRGFDGPPRRGRRNNNMGGPPPRLARGRGRERGNFGDRDRERSSTEDWDNDRGDERRDKSGGDRGRSRGRGGFGTNRRNAGRGGRFNNTGDRENRGFNRAPRYEKMNNNHSEGPEIDTWTNEAAEPNANNVSKDTDWDNWNDSWTNEEEWTGTLEETKVFTPSQIKMPEPEPVINEPPTPSSLGQRLDVGSLFSESAKFSKAPDFSQPSGDAYINQFKQAATESIKNSIGIGNSPRTPQSMNSIAGPQPSPSDSLGLSTLNPSASQVQDDVSSVLSSLSKQQNQNDASMTMSQLSQFSQSQMGLMSNQASNQLSSLSSQQPASVSSAMQSRAKSQRSKLPPPSKIPQTAVEMPGHIPRNPQFDLQFGIDFGTSEPKPAAPSFGFGASVSDNATPISTASNGSSTVISNHLSQGHTNDSTSDTNSMVSNRIVSPSAGKTNLQPKIESHQPSHPQAVFPHNSFNSSPSKSESLERDQNNNSVKQLPESLSYPSAAMDRKSSQMLPSQRTGQSSQNLSSGSISASKNEVSPSIGSSYSVSNGYGSSYQGHQKSSAVSQSQSFTHTTNSQQPQGSSYSGQFPSAGQTNYPAGGQTQYNSSPASQYPGGGQPSQYNNAQSSYSSGSQSSSQFPPREPSHAGSHPSQYSAGSQNSYSATGSGSSQYQGYQNSSSFNAQNSAVASSSLYNTSTQMSAASFTSPSPAANTYQSPSAGGSFHSRDGGRDAQPISSSSAPAFPPAQPPAAALKPSANPPQSNSSYSSQNYNTSPTPLQPSAHQASHQASKALGESLSKMTIKDASASLDNSHHSAQFEGASSGSSASSVGSLPQATSSASLSTGTTTISSSSTATAMTSSSRIASMPSTSKAPPNLPPGVPLMGQYIMGQSTMPPFYSVQPPLYGYDDVQLMQQRLPLQAGNYYDMSGFPAAGQPGSALPGTGQPRPDTQPQAPPPMPNTVPFSQTPAPSAGSGSLSGDSGKLGPRVEAQSPNSAPPGAGGQSQNPHSSAQQPSLINFHYGYYYPSMFPGAAAGLQYPMFPIPPVTNAAAAHAGTTATTQFQKNFQNVYTSKGYDELNQAQDFSKTGGYGNAPSSGKSTGTRPATSEMAPNSYSKSHTQSFPSYQGFDKAGFHGGTPPPFSLPLAQASQAGPMGGSMGGPGTTPYAPAPFLPVMAAHQAAAAAAHSPQMIHHPMQQESSSSSSRGLSASAATAAGQPKTGSAKSYGAPQYWNN